MGQSVSCGKCSCGTVDDKTQLEYDTSSQGSNSEENSQVSGATQSRQSKTGSSFKSQTGKKKGNKKKS